MSRTFVTAPAKRDHVTLRIGLVGPSSSGKTFSALRLASGIVSVTGGKIFVIDTEARRALHYADRFTFEHLAFGEPYSPDDYLAAIEHCQAQGASVIVIDSMSHEHEGPGGVLDQHETILDQMTGGDAKRRDAMAFGAWAKPKAARRRLINGLVTGITASTIMCWRAKVKTKPIKNDRGKNVPTTVGWQPVGPEEFVYEMGVSMLLLPGCDGVPTWDPEHEAEMVSIKRPGWAKPIIPDRAQIDEAMGAGLARWAAGTPRVTVGEVTAAFEGATTRAQYDAALAAAKAAGLTGSDREVALAAAKIAADRIAAASEVNGE